MCKCCGRTLYGDVCDRTCTVPVARILMGWTYCPQGHSDRTIRRWAAMISSILPSPRQCIG